MMLSLQKRFGGSVLIGCLTLAVLLCNFLLLTPGASASTVTPNVRAAAGSGAPTDTNIHYIGRWDTSSSSVAVSYWGGAYLQTDFTGRTVRARFGGGASIYVSIDGHANVPYFANGTVNFTPSALATGTHTLRIASKSEGDFIRFQGLVLDAGARTVAPTIPAKLIEFVGDSVTAGATTANQALDSYAWLVGVQLNVRHTEIAQSGICLTDKVHCGSANSIGMSKQFFKLQTVGFPNSPSWNFNRYQANVVIINLGTNDQKYGVNDVNFQANYITFLKNVRAVYPKAIILALRGFKGLKAAPTQAAVNAVNAAGDHNVHYIDTTGWLVTSDFRDSAHPKASGHIKVAKLLAPIVASYLV